MAEAWGTCNTLSLRGRHEWTWITSEWEESWEYESNVKKNLKELKVTILLTKCTFIFSGSIIETPKWSVLSLKQFYVGWPWNFSKMRVRENKACWKNSHWFVGENFHFNKLLGHVRIMLPGCKRCRGMSKIWILNSGPKAFNL